MIGLLKINKLYILGKTKSIVFGTRKKVEDLRAIDIRHRISKLSTITQLNTLDGFWIIPARVFQCVIRSLED